MSNENQPRLLSFTLDGWDVLGGKVSVSLDDRVAVLVGRNGAGKSAILEGFEAISSLAVGRLGRNRLNDTENFPKVLCIEILTPTQRRLRYQYELIPLTVSIEDSDIDESTNENDNSEENHFSWNDCCHYLDEHEELIWTTEAGITKFSQENNSIDMILGSINPFGRSRLSGNTFNQSVEMKWVYSVLRGVKIIGKSPIRRTSKRRVSLLRVMDKNRIFPGFELADSLGVRMFRLIENGEIDELESICQRVGIGERITVQKFVPSENSTEDDGGYISSILLDGINIGLLSDGTIRVLSILIEMISSSPTPLKIIEEPEMQIHPGMLLKLLSEIESYTLGENLILSTHSPQVVSWAKPDNINLIYRNDGRISVRKLSTDEIHKVAEYLNEEGDLGEWLYSGILDE